MNRMNISYVSTPNNPPHTVRTPRVKELLLWKKLAEESTKKAQKEEKEDK